MIPTLRTHLEDMLKTCLELETPDHMGMLVENIAKIVEWVAENEGIMQPSDGSWYEWLMKRELRTKYITPEEREKFEEELAWAFSQDDLDGDITTRLLKVVGLE